MCILRMARLTFLEQEPDPRVHHVKRIARAYDDLVLLDYATLKVHGADGTDGAEWKRRAAALNRLRRCLGTAHMR